jgi:hypothetical protein
MAINYDTLENVEHFSGNVSEIYTCKLIYKGEELNITYDCKKNNLIVHEWYKLTKEELNSITEELANHFMHLHNAS